MQRINTTAPRAGLAATRGARAQKTGLNSNNSAPDLPSAPGQHRMSCRLCDRGPRDRALAVLVERDGSAVWHCHRCNWSGSTRSRTPETDADREERRQARIRQQQEQARRHANAADACNRIWRQCRPANAAHPYLLKKDVPVCSARQRGRDLVLPVIDAQRRIRTLQYITPAGDKRLHPGGAKRGHFIPIASTAEPYGTVIAEGFATAASLIGGFPGWRIVAAIDCHNLHPVAVALARISDRIVLAADPDPAGLAGARAAARAVRGEIVVPDWPDDAPDPTGDFSDLRKWMREVQHAA